MAIDLQYQGNDDNALNALAELADLPVPLDAGTENRIRALAAAADIDIAAFSESDRNLIDRLAALLGSDFYVVALDDDGTKLAVLQMDALDGLDDPWLSGSFTLEQSVSVFSGAISSADRGPAQVDGESVYGIQVDVSGVPDQQLATGSATFGVGMILMDEDNQVLAVLAVVGNLDNARGIALRNLPNSYSIADAFAQSFGENFSLGMYVNTATGLVGASIGETDLGYFDGETAVGAVSSIDVFLIGHCGTSSEVGPVPVSLQLIPSAQDIDVAMPVGTRSISGQVIE